MMHTVHGSAKTLLLTLLLAACLPALAGALDARLDWGRRLVLGTPATGVVKRVAVRPGQRVEAGQLLLELDSGAARAAVNAAQAGARHARDLLDEARREYDRARELYDRTVLSDHDLQVAEIGLREAQARSAEAQAALAEARRQLDYRRLRAPFDGVVLDVRAQPGQAVTGALRVPGLLVLADDSRLWLRARVDAATLAALRGAKKPRVRLNGKEIEVTALRLGREARMDEQGVARYAVAAGFPRPADLPVLAGQAGKIVY